MACHFLFVSTIAIRTRLPPLVTQSLIDTNRSPTLTPGPHRFRRSRTATVSFGTSSIGSSSMSEGVSVAEVDQVPDLAELGGARYDATRLEPRVPGNRRSSKSVSSARPPPSTSAGSHRQFYPDGGLPFAGPSNGGQSPAPRTRNGLKRRISTPNLAKRTLVPEDDSDAEPEQQPSTLSATSNVKAFETRARSTSTSIVVPQTLLQLDSDTPTQPVQTRIAAPQLTTTIPPVPWASMYVTPPSPATTETPQPPVPSPPSGLLAQAYDLGEAIVSRALFWGKSAHRRERRGSRRSSDEDSEKGLDGSEEETFDDDEDQPRVGLGGSGGRYWGLFGEGDEDNQTNYFNLPPTPPHDSGDLQDVPYPQSLPTPALSTQSLSRGSSRRRRRRERTSDLQGGPADGWWVRVYRTWIATGTGTGKTTEVLRELGWTVAFLAGLFIVSFLVVVYAIQSMPM